MTSSVPGSLRPHRPFLALLALQVAQIAYSMHARAWMADESAWDFYSLLLGKNVGFFWERAGAIGLYRSAFWAARRLAVTDLRVLTLFYGAGLYVVWPLSLLFCWAITRKRDAVLVLFPALSFAFGSANVLGFSATESHVTHALFWVLLFAVTYRDLGKRELAIVLPCLVLFAFSYATTLVLGAILLTQTLVRLRELAWRHRGLQAFAVLAVLPIAVALYARGALDPAVSQGQGKDLWLSLAETPRHVNLLLCLVVAAVLPLLVFQLSATVLRLLAGFLVALSATLGAYHFVFPGETYPNIVGYYVRLMNLIAPLFLFGALVLYRHHARWRENVRVLATPLHLVWGGQLLFAVAMAHQFVSYTRFMSGYAAEHEGIIPVPVPVQLTVRNMGFERLQLESKIGCPLVRDMEAQDSVLPFASMWIALPAQSLLFSTRDIRSVFLPVWNWGEGWQDASTKDVGDVYYEGYRTRRGAEKLREFGHDVRVGSEVCVRCCDLSAAPERP